MFTVTEAALDRLSQKLVRKKAADDMALRFMRRTGGWKLRLDRMRPADTMFTHGSRKVLLLDETVARAMSKLTLDVKDTAAGPRLTLV
jgi:hypothetical protein